MKKSKKAKEKSRKGLLRRFISTALIIIAVAASVPIILNLYVVCYSSRYILTPEEYTNKTVDCVMVLGAGVWEDGPSHMLEERLNRGIEVYANSPTDRLLMSGDHGRVEYDEVNVMKSFAIESGAVPQEVFMDHAGFSTYESMYRARDVFEVKSLIIVTQKYHLYRAIYDARKLGLEAYGVAADGQYNYGLYTRSYNSLRESLARCKDVVWCIAQPEPTYLGSVIPISASGNLTDDENTAKYPGGDITDV